MRPDCRLRLHGCALQDHSFGAFPQVAIGRLTGFAVAHRRHF